MWLLRTAVVVLAVQVVVTVALAHVLDAVHASGARLGLVDVTLRAIRRVHRVRLIGGANESARRGPARTTVGITGQNVVTGELVVDLLGSIPAIKTKIRGTGARATLAGRLHVGAALAVNDRRGQGVESLVVDEGESFSLLTRGESSKFQVDVALKVRLAETTRGSCLLNRQVVVANCAEQEGLAGLDLTGCIRLEANGRLAIHPDRRISTVLPQVVVLLHPVLGGLRITGASVARLVIPLPRCTSSNVRPRIPILCGCTTQPLTNGLIVREQAIPRHSGNNTVPDAVIQVRTALGFTRVATVNPDGNLADINLAGGGLLGSLGRLGGGDLGDDQRAGGSCQDGQGGQGAGSDSCSLGPRVACARSTRCH